MGIAGGRVPTHKALVIAEHLDLLID